MWPRKVRQLPVYRQVPAGLWRQRKALHACRIYVTSGPDLTSATWTFRGHPAEV